MYYNQYNKFYFILFYFILFYLYSCEGILMMAAIATEICRY